MPQDMTHSVIVIPVRDGRVALAERLAGTRLAGMFTSPGGGVDPEDVTLEAAAVRELEEEAGLGVDPKRLVYLGKLTDTGPDWQPVGGHFFLLPMKPEEELVQKEPTQHGPWKWYSFREAAALRLPPVSRSLIHMVAHLGAPR